MRCLAQAAIERAMQPSARSAGGQIGMLDGGHLLRCGAGLRLEGRDTHWRC